MSKFSLSRRARLLTCAIVLTAAMPFVLADKPLTAPLPETVELKDMTWVEVRSALQSGFTSVIVPTGGIEQNGPHMILGKHDYLVTYAARRIAKEAGQTLVAPVISYVPEGDYDPPTGHMRFPGTLGLSEQAFAGILDGVARSLKQAGFKTIYFIGDHGQSQKVQADVAHRLTAEWQQLGINVIQLADYYAASTQTTDLIKKGFTPETIGQHASVIDTSELMAVHPKGVDLARYSRSMFPREHSGVYGNPSASTGELGASLIKMRIDASAARIRAIRSTAPSN